MTVLRSLVAVVAGAGFLMSAGVVGGTLATTVARLMVTVLGAVIGGWVTARLAPFSPFGHAATLAAIVGTATVSMIVGGPAARGFTAAAGAVAVLGTLAGGAIRGAASTARERVNTNQSS